ncbi:hypothetical protein FRC02_003086 [Tulasnella sp. 418]|nr:hypothetical protein FRC02_003086 [Tulasnella sp. 418]
MTAVSPSEPTVKQEDEDPPSIPLSKLPKAGKYTDIFHKGVLPGHTDFLWSRNGSNCLDPNHPIHRTPTRVTYQSPSMTIRMIPYAALGPLGSSFTRAPDPFPEEFRKRSPSNRVPVALCLISAIAVTSKSSPIRSIIRRKIRETLKLIVARGARPGKQEGTVIIREEDIGPERWLLKDWAYIIYPTIEVYKRSVTELIGEIRQALEDVKGQAMKLEDKWKKQDFTKAPIRRAPRKNPRNDQRSG